MTPKAVLRKYFNLSEVAEHLSSVTQIHHHQEVAPQSVGLTEASIAAIWQRVEQLYATGTQPAIQLCVRRRGEIVMNRAIGHARGNGPWIPIARTKWL